MLERLLNIPFKFITKEAFSWGLLILQENSKTKAGYFHPIPKQEIKAKPILERKELESPSFLRSPDGRAGMWVVFDSCRHKGCGRGIGTDGCSTDPD